MKANSHRCGWRFHPKNGIFLPWLARFLGFSEPVKDEMGNALGLA